MNSELHTTSSIHLIENINMIAQEKVKHYKQNRNKVKTFTNSIFPNSIEMENSYLSDFFELFVDYVFQVCKKRVDIVIKAEVESLV